MFSAPKKDIVGLDIEPGYVAAVQGAPGRVAVTGAACATLPVGAVRDGEVADVEAVAEVLRELFSTHRLPKRVRLGVANQRIVMRTIDLPPIADAKQLASAVRFSAQDHIPMPLDQAVLEHQTLGTVETPDGGLRTRVVLVAARRDVINPLLEATRRAGLRPFGIDLSAFAMIRALHRPGASGPVVYVSIGGLTNLAVAVGTTCLFTRAVAAGTESIAAELAQRRGLTLDHAEGWLRHVGLDRPEEQVEGDRTIVAEARTVLEEGARRVADEVRNSIDFQSTREDTGAPERMVLTGPATAIPGFCQQVGEAVGLPFDLGTVAEAKPGAFGAIEPGRLAVAAGLTIEEAAA
jgi:type IV pilus assembly protein PilM